MTVIIILNFTLHNVLHKLLRRPCVTHFLSELWWLWIFHFQEGSSWWINARCKSCLTWAFFPMKFRVSLRLSKHLLCVLWWVLFFEHLPPCCAFVQIAHLQIFAGLTSSFSISSLRFFDTDVFMRSVLCVAIPRETWAFAIVEMSSSLSSSSDKVSASLLFSPCFFCFVSFRLPEKLMVIFASCAMLTRKARRDFRGGLGGKLLLSSNPRVSKALYPRNCLWGS